MTQKPNPFPSSAPAPHDPTGLAASSPALDAAEAAVLHALQHPPRVVIPESFAARVATRAAALPQPRRPLVRSVGVRIAAWAGLVVLAASFALAPYTAPASRNLGFDLQLLLVAELTVCGVVIGRSGLHD